MRGKKPNVSYFMGRKYSLRKEFSYMPIGLAIILPLSIFSLIYLTSYSSSDDFVLYSAFLIGNGIGVMCHFCLLFTPGFKTSFLKVKNRIKEFFKNLKYKFKFAAICYKDDLLENGGIIFWLYCLIMVVNLVLFIIGFVNVFVI